MVYEVTEKTCDHRDDFGCIDNTVGTWVLILLLSSIILICIPPYTDPNTIYQYPRYTTTQVSF